MSGKDKAKQLKRMSRKFVPRRREQEIPPRKRDPKELRRSATEDILDELSDLPVVSRLDIGKALGEYDMNTSENMKHAMAELKELGVTVK